MCRSKAQTRHGMNREHYGCSCGCGCHCGCCCGPRSSAGRPYWRRFLSSEEREECLEEYQKELERELEGVKRELKGME